VQRQRVLITGLSSFWGGRTAQALERLPSVEVVVGIDTEEPVLQFERTEFVRADETFSILNRLVRAIRADTVIHAGLVVDSTRIGGGRIHERNVIGTMNLLGAIEGGDSPVRALVVKSSTLVYGSSARDPTWFTETTARAGSAYTPVERSLLEAESYLRDYAEDHANVDVAVLRCANVLGPNIATPVSKALSLPLVPKMAGFDPQLQVVEEDDVVRAVCFAVQRRLDGVYNVAGDGRLPWSEIIAIAGKRAFPLPPAFTATATGPLGRLHLVDLPPELLDLLRFGRGVDNSKLKAAGFNYRYSTAGAVEHFIGAARLRRTVGETEPRYRYESDVEAFFRHSPAVVRRD
jgi:UDP-glucose 4-epimerase